MIDEDLTASPRPRPHSKRRATATPNRKRLKILAPMSVRDLAAEPELVEYLSSPNTRADGTGLDPQA